jgi:hypothetical protein
MICPVYRSDDATARYLSGTRQQRVNHARRRLSIAPTLLACSPPVRSRIRWLPDAVLAVGVAVAQLLLERAFRVPWHG